jgi:CDP-glycerol glycerophosphotransferase (TagB/SpsB family)
LIQDLAAGRHEGFFPTPYQETHDLLSAVDVVISPLSTILIEAGLHGKPVMCMIPSEEDAGSPWAVLRDLVHFRELTDHPDVITVRSIEQFFPLLKTLLERSESEEFGTIIKEAMHEFVKFQEKTYAENITDLTQTLLRKN